MQRHGHQRIGVADDLAAGGRHPAPHGRGEIKAIAVFQRMDQSAGDIVVAHGGAGAVVGRRVGERLHRRHARPRIKGERDAQPLAVGWRDEGELGPAGGAEAITADRLAAGGAKLWQRHVDDEAERRAQRTG